MAASAWGLWVARPAPMVSVLSFWRPWVAADIRINDLNVCVANNLALDCTRKGDHSF